MTEIDAEVVRRLVVGHKADGRAVYDPQAKAEVVRLCLRPGVSVARMALQCGINANLLRRWITHGMDVSMRASRATVPTLPDVPETPTVAAEAPGASPTFLALQLAAPKPAALADVRTNACLHAWLPNGVQIELRDAGPSQLQPILEALNRLPCSDSTTR
jgi:transposase